MSSINVIKLNRSTKIDQQFSFSLQKCARIDIALIFQRIVYGLCDYITLLDIGAPYHALLYDNALKNKII